MAIPIGKIEEGERMKLFHWDVPCQACLVFSLFLSPAVWYTYKIDCMGDKVAEAGNKIISLQDGSSAIRQALPDPAPQQ